MEAKMKPIYDEYIENAEKLMGMLENKESIAWYLVSKQFDFTHSLFALRDIDVSINYAIGGLILAYFDELAEAQEWIRTPADDTDKQLEIAFEGIDALHFAIQLAIFYKLFAAGERRVNKCALVRHAFESKKYAVELLLKAGSSFEFSGDLIALYRLATKQLPWKWWKTYTDAEIPAKVFDLLFGIPFKLVYENYTLPRGRKDVWKDVGALYECKIQENHDRQVRGY
jgi:hypothetical protein